MSALPLDSTVLSPPPAAAPLLLPGPGPASFAKKAIVFPTALNDISLPFTVSAAEADDFNIVVSATFDTAPVCGPTGHLFRASLLLRCSPCPIPAAMPSFAAVVLKLFAYRFAGEKSKSNQTRTGCYRCDRSREPDSRASRSTTAVVAIPLFYEHNSCRDRFFRRHGNSSLLSETSWRRRRGNRSLFPRRSMIPNGMQRHDPPVPQ